RNARQFLDANVAELDVIVVTEKTQAALLAQQARVLGQNVRVGYLVQVGVHHTLSVQFHFHQASNAGDFFLVPFARFLQSASSRRHDVVNRSAILGRTQIRIL